MRALNFPPFCARWRALGSDGSLGRLKAQGWLRTPLLPAELFAVKERVGVELTRPGREAATGASSVDAQSAGYCTSVACAEWSLLKTRCWESCSGRDADAAGAWTLLQPDMKRSDGTPWGSRSEYLAVSRLAEEKTLGPYTLPPKSSVSPWVGLWLGSQPPGPYSSNTAAAGVPLAPLGSVGAARPLW